MSSLAEPQVASHAERRRSPRLPLALPLVVRGLSLDNRPFREETFTISVSAHGAMVVLVTTVTLGQSLVLRNSRTQDEIEGWVARFGAPLGGLAQVGIEFARPAQEFWPAEAPLKNLNTIETDEASEKGIHVLPGLTEGKIGQPVSPETTEAAPLAAAAPSGPAELAELVTRDDLLRILDPALQQAAEQAVVAAVTARFGIAVNEAAKAIEEFNLAGLRQLQVNLAHVQEHLRERAEGILQEAARAPQNEFAARLRETTSQEAARFVDETVRFSARYLAGLAEQVQATTVEACSQVENSATALIELHRRARSEMDRAIVEDRQRLESLASFSKQMRADWEIHLHACQGELARSTEQEIERFRLRLRDMMKAMLDSLASG